MFWDNVAGIYDLFVNLYNGKTHKKLCQKISTMIKKEDKILECACGTGIITLCVAPKCRTLIATDFSKNMLKKAKKKCRNYPNVSFRKADIFSLPYPDEHFDKVIAANVLHLLKEPYQALNELYRVCKNGGQIILPNYINIEKNKKVSLVSRILDKIGVNFQQAFTEKSYKDFFLNAGYKTLKFSIVRGRLSCAIAVITKA